MLMKRILFLLGLLAASANAQVPQLINYQGRISVGGTNFDGTGQFKFALVNTAGTANYWANDGTASGQPATGVSLAVSKGLYSVLLGDTSLANMTAIPASVWANADVRLRVWFNDGTNGSQLLTPDQRLAPNGYLPDGAVTSTTLAPNAVTSAKIAAGAVGNTQLTTGIDAGKITTGTFPALSGANLTGLTAGNITLGTLADARLSANVALRGGGNTFNGNQVVLSGNVGIGTGTPGFPLTFSDALGDKLSLNGQAPGVSYGFGIQSGLLQIHTGNSSGDIAFGYGSSAAMVETMRIKGNGNVGIGTTVPEDPLQIGTLSTNGDSYLSLKTAGGTAFRSGIKFRHFDNTVGFTIVDDDRVPGYGLHIMNDFFASSATCMFIERLSNNMGIGTTTPATKLDVAGEITCVAINLTSDRNAKEQFKPVNARAVLDKVARLPISEWQYKEQADARHIGPMAQDFREAFALGRDEKHITSVDADGVALAAIQGLNEKLDEKNQEVEVLKQSVHELRALVNKLAGQKHGGAR